MMSQHRSSTPTLADNYELNNGLAASSSITPAESPIEKSSIHSSSIKEEQEMVDPIGPPTVATAGPEVDTTTGASMTQTTHTLSDQTNLLPTRQLIIVFLGLSTALFCSTLDQTNVTTALPTIGTDFHASDISSWIGTAYLLTSTACQPLYGRLSDIFGRKVMLTGSIAIFFVGATLCATSKSIIELIVFRAIQGIGGGGILTMVNIVISDVVTLQDRGKYQGINGAVVATASALGPLVGGIFTEKVTWRWCFYIDLPLSGCAFIVAVLVLPLRPVTGNALEKFKRIDYTGSVIAFASAILILLSISWAGTRYAWTSPVVLAPLLIGVILIAPFIWVELKVAKIPIMPLKAFKNGHVSTCIVTSFLTGYTTFVNLYYLPQYYQVIRGDTPMQSGISVLPIILAQSITSFASGFFVSKTGWYRYNLIAGYAIWTIAAGLLTTVTATSANGSLIAFQILSGIGSGQTLQITLVAIQAAVQRSEMATITGTRNFLRMFGSTLAVACSAAVLNNTVRTKLTNEGVSSSIISAIISSPTSIRSMDITTTERAEAIAAYLSGFHILYYLMIGLNLLQFVLVLLFVKDYSLARADDKERKAAAKQWLQERKAGKSGAATDADVEKGIATGSEAVTVPPTVDLDVEGDPEPTRVTTPALTSAA